MANRLWRGGGRKSCSILFLLFYVALFCVIRFCEQTVVHDTHDLMMQVLLFGAYDT